MLLEITIGIVSSVFVVCASVWVYRCEKETWNNGICAKSGKPWRYFDTDSQGGRGYTDGEGNYFWVSWGVDK